MAYAVIQTGGKQYRVESGNEIEVEKLDAEVGADIQLSEVLLVADGGKIQVGAPFINGAKVGAISSGAFILADAGLLTDRRATVHWEYAELFRARYPQVRLTRALYVVDRDVFTCSGGTAALDMMSHFIGEQFG